MIKAEQEKIAVLNTEIDEVQKDERFLKYAAAKAIATSNNTAWRGDRLSRILAVFSRLQQVWWANVSFSNFTLDYQSLSLEWNVSDLSVIYGKGWVVDMFNELEFLTNINIPAYKKSENWFTFNLSAQILLDNVSN